MEIQVFVIPLSNFRYRSGKELMTPAVVHAVNCLRGRIVNPRAVAGHRQIAHRLDITADLNIRCIPDFRLPGHLFAQILHHIPVMVRFELMGMAPDVKQRHVITAVQERFQIFFRLIVMARRVPEQEIIRKGEFSARNDGP